MSGAPKKKHQYDTGALKLLSLLSYRLQMLLPTKIFIFSKLFDGSFVKIFLHFFLILKHLYETH